ncbi:MAG: C39 family peptidase [Planctomycetota bacterium]
MNRCAGRMCLYVCGIVAFAAFLQVQARPVDKTVLIKSVPHLRQKPDFCGEACIAMYLKKLGYKVTQDDVFNLSDVEPALARGCVTKDMERVLKRVGFKPGIVWNKIDPRKSKDQLEAQWNILLANLRDGIPSIVCMHYDDRPKSPEHFRLVLGYDGKTNEVIYHEPAEKSGAYRRMKHRKFLSLWPLKYKKDRWLAIHMSLRAGKLSLPESPVGFTDADYAQHIMKLKPNVSKDFTIVLQKPFVVVGDEKPGIVRYRAERTVKWFVNRIRRLYFKKDPPGIYDIWLFKDDSSYRKHTKELFNNEPDTPFGYCSDAHGALIMNIGTGGGTLCHEIVHSFINSNFPDCPAWFNEGLASLYEQCSSRGDSVVGLTNWRLAGLKKEIQADTLPSFKTLLSTTSYRFYNMGKGNNYAQARYLCYYLQEKDLLVKFYNAFSTNVNKDPSGYETLKKILNENNMKDFKKRWEKWVLKLHFP